MVEVIKHGEKNIIDCNFCGAQLRYLHSQANNGHGKVIYTTQMDDIY